MEYRSNSIGPVKCNALADSLTDPSYGLYSSGSAHVRHDIVTLS